MNTPDAGFRLMDRYRARRFTVLFAGLIVLFVAPPIFEGLGLSAGVSHRLMGTVFVFMLVSAVVAVCTTRTHAISAVVVLLPAMVLAVLDIATGSHRVEIAKNAMAMLGMAYVIVVLTAHVFRQRRVTFDTIAASLCVYLLLGFVWAFAYSIVDLTVPGSFQSNVAESEAAMRYGSDRSALVTYYSFVTLTTLGYGDVVPKTELARTLAVVQAVTGQLYLTVLVARLVGMHIAQGAHRPEDES